MAITYSPGPCCCAGGIMSCCAFPLPATVHATFVDISAGCPTGPILAGQIIPMTHLIGGGPSGNYLGYWFANPVLAGRRWWFTFWCESPTSGFRFQISAFTDSTPSTVECVFDGLFGGDVWSPCTNPVSCSYTVRHTVGSAAFCCGFAADVWSAAVTG